MTENGAKKELQNVQGTVKQFKDAVFRMLFGNPQYALMLYNALNGTNYEDVGKLEFNTLENAIFMNVKNDLSFLIAHSVNIYEHQSTVNPNMPLRNLFYVADLLQNMVKDRTIYSSKMIRIPTPKFIVFYNGLQKMPERMHLKLSNMFEIPTDNPALELKVTLLNINQGMNEDLMKRCPILGEYMQYVAMVREYAEKMEIEKAVIQAVDQCIKTGVLRDFLQRQKAEVVKMSIYEYDEEKEMQLIRADEREIGEEIGKEIGKEIGMEIGEERYALLVGRLIQDKRQEDIFRTVKDKGYRIKVMEEYGI